LPGKLEQRGLIGVVISPGGDPLLVCSTHFDHGRDNPSRAVEAQIVADFARESSIPVILAGDLNALPGSDVLSILGEVFEIPQHPAPTFPSDIPERRIDYILPTHIPGWQLTETRVVPEPLASDHRPVLAIFKRIDS
ncbi:MAG: endonuclease/exonuclease/phosphatase family protein, partial [Planctomycetota bacterium]|nr:endonuclease/exonuclease/phosphatase family protein [Planctomycetota bacterium]